MKKIFLVYIGYFLLIAYLLFNTGVISDEFGKIAQLQLDKKGFVEMFHPKNIYSSKEFIETPIGYFSHYIWFSFFQIDNAGAENIFKIVYLILCFYFTVKFWQIYLNRHSAFLISFLFIFFPTHEATAYWFMGQYLTISIALYLYAFYLAHNNRMLLAFLAATIASFISYGSSAPALALFILFALNKELKKGLVLLVPNIIYAFYYIWITKIMAFGADKLTKGMDIFSIIKLFLLQFLSFIDAMIGPSMWLKVYYAFSQLTILSIVIGIALTALFYKRYQGPVQRYNGKLILCALTLTVLPCVFFTATGLYPQLAFNLGNRVTIFGSLLFAYLIALAPMSHKLRTIVFGLLIFTILGISDHWKAWSAHQQIVISRIKNNQALKNYQEDKIIYVSGNQYSRYGPISHIEFLSEEWVTRPIFNLLFERRLRAKPINKRHRENDGYLIDSKYNQMSKLNDYINIYDSEKDLLFAVRLEEINNYIDNLAPENRHWVQILNIKFIKDKVIALSPRLKYAL